MNNKNNKYKIKYLSVLWIRIRSDPQLLVGYESKIFIGLDPDPRLQNLHLITSLMLKAVSRIRNFLCGSGGSGSLLYSKAKFLKLTKV
jgi:hypothetical protein